MAGYDDWCCGDCHIRNGARLILVINSVDGDCLRRCCD